MDKSLRDPASIREHSQNKWMYRGPVHEIEILHKWGSPEPQDVHGSRLVTLQTCEDCEAEQQTLHIDSTESRDSGGEDQSKLWRIDGSIDFVKDIEDAMAAPFVGTKYNNLEDFATKIRQQYECAIKENDITLGLTERVISASPGSRKFLRKILLTHRQGLVCNRCDSIVYSIDDLTEDHILPQARGGQSKLINLQLLCLKCNEEKGSSEPDHRDQSPYAHEGPSCKHTITCREVAALRASHDSPKI